MKTTKWVVEGLVSSVCAVAVASSALAEAPRGFYVGVGVGESSFDLEHEEFDDVLINQFAFAPPGTPVISGSSTFEDGDTSLAFFAGYRFFPYLAVEASYIDLGTAEYRFTGTMTISGPSPSVPASFTTNMDIETKGFALAGIGSLPMGGALDLHGRLGLLVARTDLSAVAMLSSTTVRDSDSLDSASAFFGVGAGFHLGEHWSLSLDWARYVNVGDEDKDDDYETDEGFDIDALSVSASYQF